jgi:hypothetical protein
MRLAQPRTYKDERGQPLLSMDGPIQLNEELFANPKLYATILKGGFSDPTEKVMRKYYIPSWEEGEVREEVKKQDIRDGIALIESSHKAAKSLNLTGERYFDFMVEVAATSAVYNAATDMSRTPLRPGARVMQNNNQPKTS